jgi:hypothetical protein
MDQVTQQTAANSEESASAAEELSSQAEEMRSLVARFKLSNASSTSSYSSPRASSYQQPAQRKIQPEKVLVGAGAGRKNGKNGSHPIDPKRAIPFDDDQTLQEF